MRNKIVRLSVLVIFLLVIIVLLVKTNADQNAKNMNDPEIIIKVQDGDENAFLTKNELLVRLHRNGIYKKGMPFEKVDTKKIESYIKNMPEVKSVAVYSSIGNQWTIDILERKVIARIFNQHGETFYLDSDGKTMPISNLHTARVLVATGYIPDKMNSKSVSEIINNDTLKTIQKLDDLYRISYYVCNNPFLQSFVSQIHLEKNGDFVLIPLIDKHKIVFGTAKSTEEVKEKFEKLMIFYKEGIPYEGWNKYEVINLKYQDQIVGKKVEGFVEKKDSIIH